MKSSSSAWRRESRPPPEKWRTTMLDDHNLCELDLSTIDTRALTPAEWEALKSEVVRRAHAERTRATRAFVRWLRFRWTRTRLESDPAERSCLYATPSGGSRDIASTCIRAARRD